MNVLGTYRELLRQGYCMPLDEVREEGIVWWAPVLGFVTGIALLTLSLLGIFALSGVGAGDVVGVALVTQIIAEMIRVVSIGLAVASASVMTKFVLVGLGGDVPEVRGE